MKKLFKKIFRDPFSFIKRAFYKTIIGPLKYQKKDDYKAEEYWRNRFSKYGLSLRGSGDEGLSEEENKKNYSKLAISLENLLSEENFDYQSIKVLDIGCGTGFFTKFLYNSGVKNYVGIDITNVLFPQLKERFTDYVFLKKDISTEKIEEKYDLIIMIDIIEHIVKKSKFTFAMENINHSLSENGVFVIAPVMKKNKKHLFYLKSWSQKDILQNFINCKVKEGNLLKDYSYLLLKKT